MDRFIEICCFLIHTKNRNLKSNMDRFIVLICVYQIKFKINLKSNMDRFIVNNYQTYKDTYKKFKIQYG